MEGSPKKRLLWEEEGFAQRSSTAEQLTGYFAGKMLQQAGIPHLAGSQPLIVLDNACGTGVVTQALQDMVGDRPANTVEVTCGDLADAMVNAATQRISSAGWTNTKALKVDAQDTKLPSDHFTHVFTNFGPMLFPNHSAMLSECHRMLSDQGVCAFTTWKKVGWMDDVRDAIDSTADLPRFPAGDKFVASFSKGEWWDEAWIENEFTRHGFVNVEVNALPNKSVVEHGEQLQLLLRPIMAIVNSCWTAEEKEKYATANTGGSADRQIEQWFKQKYAGPVEWNWAALVATGIKAS